MYSKTLKIMKHLPHGLSGPEVAPVCEEVIVSPAGCSSVVMPGMATPAQSESCFGPIDLWILARCDTV
jgi:hypothetical protein